MSLKSRVRRIVEAGASLTGIPRTLEDLARRTERLEGGLSYTDRGTQIALGLKYRELLSKGTLLGFDEVEFRNHSQNGEDGILWYLFSLIGTAHKTCVEICAANGIECNSANLLINHGWTGLLVDGDEANVKFGQQYYNSNPDTFSYPPRFVHAWVTTENVNDLLTRSGLQGDVDLLSLDIDGVDYWIWNALQAVSPRVVIAEVQAIWGAERSVSVPYRADFKAKYVNGFGVYSGASLPAFVKLGRTKGYRLIGCQRYGFNAVFMRNDVGTDIFREVSADTCFDHPFARWAARELRPLVADLEWQEI